jgi:hypothetical protein
MATAKLMERAVRAYQKAEDEKQATQRYAEDELARRAAERVTQLFNIEPSIDDALIETGTRPGKGPLALIEVEPRVDFIAWFDDYDQRDRVDQVEHNIAIAYAYHCAGCSRWFVGERVDNRPNALLTLGAILAKGYEARPKHSCLGTWQPDERPAEASLARRVVFPYELMVESPGAIEKSRQLAEAVH